jgi:hypothetical protein
VHTPSMFQCITVQDTGSVSRHHCTTSAAEDANEQWAAGQQCLWMRPNQLSGWLSIRFDHMAGGRDGSNDHSGFRPPRSSCRRRGVEGDCMCHDAARDAPDETREPTGNRHGCLRVAHISRDPNAVAHWGCDSSHAETGETCQWQPRPCENHIDRSGKQFSKNARS